MAMTPALSGNRLTSEIARQSRLAGDIARTQTSIATGRRLLTPSDDSFASARVAVIDRVQADSTTWARLLAGAVALAVQADGVLASLSDRMIAAKTALVAGASGTASAADRTTYATELRALAAEVAALRATSTPAGDPLFANDAPLAVRVDTGRTVVPVDSAIRVFQSGGVALAQELVDAAAAIDSGDRMRIDTALARIDSAVAHVAAAAGDQGLRAAQIDRLIDRHAVQAIDLAAERSGLEDTDLTTAIAQLNAQQLTLEAAQAAFARISRRTLFDILG